MTIQPTRAVLPRAHVGVTIQPTRAALPRAHVGVTIQPTRAAQPRAHVGVTIQPTRAARPRAHVGVTVDEYQRIGARGGQHLRRLHVRAARSAVSRMISPGGNLLRVGFTVQVGSPPGRLIAPVA